MNPVHPEPERLALAALPAEPDDPAVVAHLLGCARCRTEVDDLRRTVDLAREGGVGDLVAPPPRVWQAIVAELGSPVQNNGQGPTVAAGAAEVHTRPAPVPSIPRSATGGRSAPPPPSRHRRTAGGRRILPLLLAATVGLLAGVGLGWALAPGKPPAPVVGASYPLAPVGGVVPGASGTVALSAADGERRMVVQVQGVTSLPGGDHLEAWLMDASGTRLVPLGTLTGADGTYRGAFTVPADLPLGEFGRVDVSAERWDGDPGHSAVSVVRGTL